jgi:hypothetical protein
VFLNATGIVTQKGCVALGFQPEQFWVLTAKHKQASTTAATGCASFTKMHRCQRR